MKNNSLLPVAASLLGSQAWIPLRAWMFICCICCVLFMKQPLW